MSTQTNTLHWLLENGHFNHLKERNLQKTQRCAGCWVKRVLLKYSSTSYSKLLLLRQALMCPTIKVK